VHDSDASIAGLADELTRAGQKEAALAVLAEATGPDEKPGRYAVPFERAGTFAALGAAHARLGDKARAASYFRRALRLAEANEEFGEENGLRVLIEVGARYAEAGMSPDARARKLLRGIVRGVEADRE
jgi:tetratricopeptide (TPR) repeat protein